jgi:hypothetical protein
MKQANGMKAILAGFMALILAAEPAVAVTAGARKSVTSR